MKPYLPLLILCISCSKQRENIIEKPVEPISMSQTRLMYNGNNAFIGTLAVIHFHRVDDPALIKMYKALPARQAICPEMRDTLVTVIGRPCGSNCQLK